MAGSMIGGAVDPAEGPQLQDLKPQASAYGWPIPIVYSVMALGGNVIWAPDLKKIGDAGGKGSPSATSAQGIYAANAAILICEGSGDKKLGHIWAGPDRRLVYDPATQKMESGSVRFYNGSEDQLPDPLIESYLGAGNVPAYRGYCYVVIENFNVTDHDGNRLPFFTIEVGDIDSEVVENDAPANLGSTVAVHLMESDTYFLTVYMGSFQGVLKTEKATGVTVQNRVISVYDIAAGDVFFYDSGRDVVVHSRHGLSSVTSAGVLYTALNMASNTFFGHTFAIADGETTAGAVMVAGSYVFAFNTSSGDYKFYFVDPDTFAVTNSLSITGDGSTLKEIYSIDDVRNAVFGITSNGAVYFDFGISAIAVLGATASTAGNTTSKVDPDTGLLWSVARDGGVLNYSVYSSSALVISDSLASSFNQLARVPIVPGGGYVRIIGNQWLSVVYEAVFDATSAAVVRYGATTTDGVNGLYVGINVPDAAVYVPSVHPTQTWPQFVWWIGDNLLMGATNADMSLGVSPTLYLGTVGTSTAGSATLHYQTLDQVVTDLSLRAGLTADQIDVTQLTDQVDGYPIANQMAVKDALSPLMAVYYFDAVEDQGKIVFVKRGGALAAEIPDDDLGAHASDVAEPQDLLSTTRITDEELPGTFSVTYVLAATSYSAATKYSRRLVGFSQSEQSMQLPMVLTDQKAQEVSAVNLHDAWIARLVYAFNLTRKYGYLQPTDIVGIQGYTMRITKITQAGGVLQCEAVRDDSDTYTPHVLVTETPPDPKTVNLPSLSLLELM